MANVTADPLEVGRVGGGVGADDRTQVHVSASGRPVGVAATAFGAWCVRSMGRRHWSQRITVPSSRSSVGARTAARHLGPRFGLNFGLGAGPNRGPTRRGGGRGRSSLEPQARRLGRSWAAVGPQFGIGHFVPFRQGLRCNVVPVRFGARIHESTTPPRPRFGVHVPSATSCPSASGRICPSRRRPSQCPDETSSGCFPQPWTPSPCRSWAGLCRLGCVAFRRVRWP